VVQALGLKYVMQVQYRHITTHIEQKVTVVMGRLPNENDSLNKQRLENVLMFPTNNYSLIIQ